MNYRIGLDIGIASIGWCVLETDANGGMDTAIFEAVRAAGLSVSFWNVRKTAYITYMDAGPLRITKQNTADKIDLDVLYLADKTF